MSSLTYCRTAGRVRGARAEATVPMLMKHRACSSAPNANSWRSAADCMALPLVKAEPKPVDEAKQDKPGFFKRLFGGTDKPEVKAEPIAKAEAVAPAPAPTPQAAPAPVAPAPVVKEAAAKPAATKAAPAKRAPAHKPAQTKKATAKSEPAKKAVANTQAKAG